jgi:uncharacterized protein YhfF
MDEKLPPIEFAFPGPLRDRLLDAIQSGLKTSTSSLLREYEVGDEPLPTVGVRGAAIDSAGEPVFVVETTAVEVVRLCDVPLSHTLSEGEGYLTVADWRAGHVRFWTSDAMRTELGTDFELNDDSLVVLEQFLVVR